LKSTQNTDADELLLVGVWKKDPNSVEITQCSI
jgi:hypothetical protein